MILSADFHTHTPYSHGKNTVYENALQAKKMGMQAIGISDHGFSHLAFGVKRKEVPALKEDCKRAEEELSIRVLVGIESNILGESGKTDLLESDYPDFDLYLAGKHVFVRYDRPKDMFTYFAGNFFADKLHFKPSKSLVQADTWAYLNAIQKNPIDILTHPNFLVFADVVEVAKCCADYGTYFELNSKKVHLTDEELSLVVQKTSVNFVVSSDAHSKERVGDTKLVDELLSRVSVPKERIFNIEGRMPSFRFADWKKRHG